MACSFGAEYGFGKRVRSRRRNDIVERPRNRHILRAFKTPDFAPFADCRIQMDVFVFRRYACPLYAVRDVRARRIQGRFYADDLFYDAVCRDRGDFYYIFVDSICHQAFAFHHIGDVQLCPALYFLVRGSRNRAGRFFLAKTLRGGVCISGRLSRDDFAAPEYFGLRQIAAFAKARFFDAAKIRRLSLVNRKNRHCAV